MSHVLLNVEDNSNIIFFGIITIIICSIDVTIENIYIVNLKHTQPALYKSRFWLVASPSVVISVDLGMYHQLIWMYIINRV